MIKVYDQAVGWLDTLGNIYFDNFFHKYFPNVQNIYDFFFDVAFIWYTIHTYCRWCSNHMELVSVAFRSN